MSVALKYRVCAPPPQKKNKKNNTHFDLTTTTEQSIFQDLNALINRFFSNRPCWIEHLLLIIDTHQDHQIWLMNLFILWVISYAWTVIFGICPILPWIPRHRWNDSLSPSINCIWASHCVQWSVYCLTVRFTIQARQNWHWDFFVAGWMLVLAAYAAEAVVSRASELWKSGKSRKWQSIRIITHKIKSSQPNLMILVIHYNEERDALYPSKVKKILLIRAKSFIIIDCNRLFRFFFFFLINWCSGV